MVIHKALNKYGHSNFSLEILEYCDPTEAIKREQYFLSLLKPNYNTLTIAGSLLGFQHSDSTKQKMRLSHRDSQNSGRFKKAHKKIEGAGQPSQKIEVFDNKTNQTTTYDSMSEAAIALNIKRSIISMYFKNNQQKPYKGILL
jgi:hypothetical protein